MTRLFDPRLHFCSAHFARISILALLACVVTSASRAQQPIATEHPPAFVANAPNDAVHQGGVLQESFAYHRGGIEATTAEAATTGFPRPQGWYGYGFPVSSYRWGWFGASRYYPRVTWHKGFNNDQKRWAYRQGY